MSQLYPKAKEKFLGAEINVTADTIKAILVDLADYTFAASHEVLSDVPANARVATTTLTNVTRLLGVLDADNAAFSAVTGDESEALILYKDTGIESTSALIAYIDTATGLPVIPNGGDINIVWDNGTNKIFRL